MAGEVLGAVWPGIATWALAAAILPWLNREHSVARVVLNAFSAFLIARYVLWRGLETLPSPGFTADFLAGLVFYAVEAITLTGVAINLMFLGRVRTRSADADRNAAWFRERSPLPRVDVLIPTYNEDRDILERTIIGALALRYPALRVWVCDDGRRRWLEDLCAAVGCGYITRPDNRHAKAGNINNALAHLATLAAPPQFIAILDADFVPRAEFLERTLPLFRDPEIGIVQTPQHFSNPDPIQSNLSVARAWPDEQRFFFDVVMASRDAWGTAFCCGTSSVIRYAPLAAMGGFPVDSVTEDYLVTLRMKERGFLTAYLNEILSLGLAPEGLKEYITQRGRWCLGFIQICRGRSGPLSRSSSLSFIDRLSLVEGFISWAFAYSYRIVGIVVPIAYLLFGIEALEADLADLLGHFLPYFVWNTMVVSWLAEGRIMPVMTDVCQLLAAPTVLKSVVAGLLSPGNQRFKVTAKGGDRSARFVEWPILRFLLVLLALTVSGVMTSWLTDSHLDDGGTGLMAIVWSWYNILVLVVASFVCIERPRLRTSERFDTHETVTIECGTGFSCIAGLADVSITGARLRGRSLVAVGARVKLVLPGLAIVGAVVRSTAKDFAIRFDDDLATRTTVIRYIYARPHQRKFLGVDPRKLGVAVARRLLG